LDLSGVILDYFKKTDHFNIEIDYPTSSILYPASSIPSFKPLSH